jgi:hypothetical protein
MVRNQKSPYFLKLSPIIILAVLFWPLLSWQPAQAAAPAAIFTITVDTTVDDNSLDDCTDITDDDCSLRGAISFANATEVGSEININVPADTYTLTLTGRDEENNATGDLDKIARTVFLIGAGSSTTTIDANSIDRALDNHGGILHVEQITIQNGNVTTGSNGGGGIINRNNSTLYLDQVAVVGNTVQGSDSYIDIGGGVANQHKLYITNSAFMENEACQGGGIASNTGWMTITDAIIDLNVARNVYPNCMYGGGITTLNTPAQFELLRVNITNNGAIRGGGVFYNGNNGTISDSTIQGNQTYEIPNNGGGGIYNFGVLTLKNSTLNGNLAGSSPYAYGVGGGIANRRTISLSNVTITGNAAWRGGGIATLSASPDSIVNLDHCTLYRNDASGQGSEYYAETNNLTSLHNTILNSAIPAAGNTCYFPSAGQLNNLGYNQVDNNANCYLSAGMHDLVDVFLLLNPLAMNGGLTQTMSLPDLSLAIDAADPATTQTRDQRGFYRPVDGDAIPGSVSDIGAFEYASFPLTVFGWLPLIMNAP